MKVFWLFVVFVLCGFLASCAPRYYLKTPVPAIATMEVARFGVFTKINITISNPTSMYKRVIIVCHPEKGRSLSDWNPESGFITRKEVVVSPRSDKVTSVYPDDHSGEVACFLGSVETVAAR